MMEVVVMTCDDSEGDFQKENKYNKLLPYADILEEESKRLYFDIKTNLVKSVLGREMRPGCALWTSRLIKYIKIYGLKFSKEDHIAWIKLFYELLIIPDLEPTRINKCATTLVQLLKKKYLLSRDELQLQWRPLYELCIKVMEKSKTDIGMYRYSSNFESSLYQMIRTCRIYFPASSTQEILDEFRPKMCAFHSSDMTNTVRCLELFLPNLTKPEEANISYKLWFEELMTLWDVCHDDNTWENYMMWIMTGLARFQIGHIDWEPYIPSMFVRFQRTFSLPVAFKQKHMGRQHKIEISAISIWIVCILNGNNNVGFFHFEKFMQSLESYYHSANLGRWIHKLRELLRQLSYYFIQRVHKERHKTPTWENPIPEHFKLTDEDIDRFVNIMKPCIEQAMYNRVGLQDTTLTLQYLASIRPNIIIPMTLEKLYSSMSSLTEPHKLTSSMMAVIACGRYIVEGGRNSYPEGPTHIIPLLVELLPGIDPNDIRKSYVTFNFIVHFVNMIPLINSSEASTYHQLSEEEHAICEASAGFEDFVLQFFDKLCVWMESNSLDFIRLEQSNNENYKNRLETISETALGSVVSVVLNQCSPEIFKSALRKIYNFVTNKIMEIHVSGKMLAICCHCFAKVNPKETLKLFLPYLCERIEELIGENPNIQKEEQIDDELLYNLLMLSELVNGRSELLHYMDQLMNILDKTLYMKCQVANQMASRMLELMMSSLTSIQPSELKSCESDYGTPVKDFLSVREWGKAQKINDIRISWYVPGKKEVGAVQQLLNKYLVPELSKLEKYSTGELGLTRPELKQSLKIIIATLSCQPLMPVWEEPVFHLVDSVLDPWSFNLTVSNSETVVTMPDGQNIRKVIVDIVHKVQRHLLQRDEGDTLNFRNIISIYNIILFNKTRGQDFEFHWKSFHMTKKLLEDRLHQKKLHLRHVLIDRVVLQQEFRIESRSCSFTKTHRQILLDLFELSTSRYSEVRIAAQSKLYATIGYFPYSYTVLTKKINKVLQMDSQACHEKFKGCLYILLGPKSSPIVARHDWTFIQQLWPSLVRSMPSEKPSIINLIAAVIDVIDKYFPTIAINLVIPQSTLTAAYALSNNVPECDLNDFQNRIDDGEVYLKMKSEERRKAYEGTLDALTDALETGNLHWRFKNMAINLIKDLVHFDVKYNPRIVKFFLKALIDESITVRKLAMKILVFILAQNKNEFQKVEIDPYKFSSPATNRIVTSGIREDNKWLLYNSSTAPKSAKEWDEPRYLHNQYTGYNTWPKKLEVFDSSSKQVTAAKRMNDLSEIEGDIYGFFSDETCVATLIKYLSMEEKKGRDQFNVYRFFTFKNLFKMFEDKLLPVFIPHLERLVHDKLESSHRCASEIISGIIRGAKHWEFEKVDKLWATLIPILETATVNASTETLTDWALCFTMGLESRDPNRYHWLLEYLLQDPLKDPTSFVSCTRLHLLYVSMSQQSWRNSEISNRLIDYFKPHLSHPFQNIRDKISVCLAVALGEVELGHGGDYTDGLKTKRFFQEISSKLDRLYNISIAKVNSDDNGDTDDTSLNRATTEEKDSLIRLFKIVAKFMTTTLVRVNYSARAEFLELIPLAALFQNNEVDEELATASTNMLVVLSETVTLPKYIPNAIKVIKRVAKCPSWSARALIAEFLPIYVFYNMANINSRKDWVLEVQSVVLELLEDTQHEVRVQAAKVLSGLLHCQFIPEPVQLLVDFKQKARNKFKKKETAANNNMRLKHAGVLGLCAFIEAHPYDVPDFLPDIFEQLRPHLNDPQPIPATIRKTLGDFKRTHHNNWETHKLKFTEEELCLLSDLSVPPSYYV